MPRYRTKPGRSQEPPGGHDGPSELGGNGDGHDGGVKSGESVSISKSTRRPSFIPDNIRRLAERIPESKSSTADEDATWAINHVLLPPSGLRAMDIPSRQALLMYYWARTDRKGLDDLMKGYVLKRVHASVQEVEESGWEDDGREYFEVLERIEAMHRQRNPGFAMGEASGVNSEHEKRH